MKKINVSASERETKEDLKEYKLRIVKDSQKTESK